MSSRLKQLRKGLLVGVGALVVSTLGIQASDLMRGVDGSLTGLLSEGTGGPCGPYAVQMLNGPYAFCVDIYEASPGSECPESLVQSVLDTQTNLKMGTCAAVSEPEADPWPFVNLSQAQQLCARGGKRLPTNEEWHLVASGSGDTASCAIDTPGQRAVKTGTSECVTSAGVHDMIGNVWEWTGETVTDGLYEGRALPEEGYVVSADQVGLVLETSNDPDGGYGDDYAWINQSGVRGILRGGFYASGDDAGIYAQNISVAPNFTAVGVGFRCVKDL